jgi:hypothetical protein
VGGGPLCVGNPPRISALTWTPIPRGWGPVLGEWHLPSSSSGATLFPKRVPPRGSTADCGGGKGGVLGGVVEGPPVRSIGEATGRLPS